MQPRVERPLGPSQELHSHPVFPNTGEGAFQTPLLAAELMGALGHSLNVQTPTCKVDTSTGPLSCPTRKNSTVTVFFSGRREAPERWVNSGKARARAQAEAKASARSQTICSTEKQSCEERCRGQDRAHPGSCDRKCWGSQLGQRPPWQFGHRSPNQTITLGAFPKTTVT